MTHVVLAVEVNDVRVVGHDLPCELAANHGIGPGYGGKGLLKVYVEGV